MRTDIAATARHSILVITLFAFVCGAGNLSAQDDKKKAADEKKPAPAQSIFPDKNLEKAVRQQVFAKRNNNEPITADDVKNISTVKGDKMGIKDLRGLEHCHMLASLELSGNEIKDLSPIKDLKHIQLLDVSKNQIADLTPLKDTIALQYIEVSGNQVKSLEPLRGLERLSSLYASDNQIANIGPIVDLPKLSSLYLDNNQLQNIAGLEKLTRVWSIGLRGNQIQDIAPLKGTKPMSFIFLENNQISNLAPLVEMMKEDLNGEKRFAPYVRVYLAGNPLDGDPAKAQLAELKKLGIRLEDYDQIAKPK